MFGFLKPRPPLSTAERARVDLHMRRCVQLFGKQTLRSAKVIGRLIDVPLDTTDEMQMLESANEWVAKAMDAEQRPFELEVVPQKQLGGAAAMLSDDCASLTVAAETLADSLRTITAVAHSYAQVMIQQASGYREEDQNGRLIETLVICRGFGVLLSDASIYQQNWSDGVMTGWETSWSGFMNASEIGYALSLFASVRSEAKPDWSRWLRTDSKVILKRALQYQRWMVSRGRPLLFDAPTIPAADSSQAQLADWIAGEDPVFSLVASWRISELDELEPVLIDALLRATHASDSQLIPLAIQLLAGGSDPTPEVRQRMETLLRDSRPEIARAVLKSAYAMDIDLQPHLPFIGCVLEYYDSEADDILAVLSAMGTRASELDGTICKLLPGIWKAADHALLEPYLACLAKITENPHESLRLLVRNDEIRDELSDMLNQLPQHST